MLRIQFGKAIFSKSAFNKACLTAAVVTIIGTANTTLASNATTHNPRHHVVDRKTEKVKTDNGFIRTTTKTDDKDETAIRKTDVAIDKAEKSRTTTTSGTTFDGKTYSGESTAHKTDTGYVSQGQYTTAEGKVINRSVNATVDKNAGTVTEEVSVTPQGGETKTKTVVHPLRKHQ